MNNRSQAAVEIAVASKTKDATRVSRAPERPAVRRAHARIIAVAVLSLLLSGPALKSWAQDGPGMPPAAGFDDDDAPPPSDDAGRAGPPDDARQAPEPGDGQDMRRGGAGGGFEERRGDRRDRRHGRGGWGRHGDRRGGWDGPGGDNRGRPQDGHFGKTGRFLGFIKTYVETVQDSRQAVGLAALGIKEHYKRAGKPAEAIPIFEEQLAKTKDQRTRNVLLFAIRQICEETKNEEKFFELNKQILRENTQ